MPQAPITRKGRFRLLRAGQLVSEHNSLVEAYSNAEDGDFIEGPNWQVGMRPNFVQSLQLSSVSPAYTLSDTSDVNNPRNDDNDDWVPDGIPAGWADSISILIDQDDVTDNTATWISFTSNIGCQVGLPIDDNISLDSSFNDWTNSGVTTQIAGKQTTVYTKEFAPGTVTIPGVNGSASDLCPTPLVRAGYARVANAASTGLLQFQSASYTGDDDGATITFFVERTGGTAGAASVTISVSAGGANGTLNTASASWSSGEGGTKSGTVTTNDVSGDQQMTLALSGFTGAAEGSRSTTLINIIDQGTTPTAQEYFINGGTGSDSNDGESAGNPWLTIGRASSVQAVAGGNVDIWVETGTYRNDPITPANSGTDDTHRIRYKPRTGDVTIQGPSSGQMDYGIDNTQDYISVLRDSGNEFIIDGEGTGYHEATPSANIKYVMLDSGDNNVWEFSQMDTQGWAGVVWSGDNTTFRLNLDTHGTPDNGAGQDTGNTMQPSNSLGYTESMLIEGDGGSTSGDFKRGGHAILETRRAKGIIRGIRTDNYWGDISGFTSTEGNKHLELRARANFWQLYDSVLTRSRFPGDGETPTIIKLMGRQSLCCRNIFADAVDRIISSIATNSGGIAIDGRIAHNTGYLADGTFLKWQQANGATPQYQGQHYPIRDFKVKNNIIWDVANNPNNPSDNVIMRITWRQADTGDSWENNIIFAGNLVETSLSNVYIRIDGDGGNPGRQSLQWYEDNYPANFFGNVPVSDPNFLSTTYTGTWAQVRANFAPQSGGALNGGVDLTTANGAGVSSTTLVVDDSWWFPDPRGFEDPLVGDWSSGFLVNIAGVGNVEYTAIDYSTHTLTLATNESWSDGDAVNYNFTGSAPDIGAVQS